MEGKVMDEKCGWPIEVDAPTNTAGTVYQPPAKYVIGFCSLPKGHKEKEHKK